MAQRKVLIKYFPKNFDPKLLVKRGRGKDKLMVVRNMLPMSLRCNVCGNYLYIGTKFNMRMQICNEETYLGIKVFRFYLKCTYCYNEISFKTDPKNHDYIVQDGGTRNYQPIKDAEQAQKLMKKMRKDQKQGNSMKFLETKTYDSKREMELMEALDDIKNLNKRHALIDPEDLLNNLFVQEEENDKFTEEEERQIDARFDELRKKKLMELSTQEGGNGEATEKMKEQDIVEGKFSTRLPELVQVPQEDIIEEQAQKKSTQFDARLHAIKKGNLFKQQTDKSATQKPKKQNKFVMKVKSIKKAVISEKQHQKAKEKEQEQEQEQEQEDHQ